MSPAAQVAGKAKAIEHARTKLRERALARPVCTKETHGETTAGNAAIGLGNRDDSWVNFNTPTGNNWVDKRSASTLRYLIRVGAIVVRIFKKRPEPFRTNPMPRIAKE